MHIKFITEEEHEVYICLDEPNEFFYENDHKIFTINEKEIFIKFITGNDKRTGLNRWCILKIKWNNFASKYENMERSHNNEMPDYNLLKPDRSYVYANINSPNYDKVRGIVYGDDGMYPHIRFELIKDDIAKKTVCVRLDRPEYYPNGQYEFFTEDEKQIFIDYINGKDEIGITNWKCLAHSWNMYSMEYPNMRTIKNLKHKKIPDYNKL